MAVKNYIQAKNIPEVLDCLGREAGMKLVCGGTDVAISLREGSFGEDITLVDISRVQELQYIKEDGDFIEVGAGTTMAEIADSPLISKSSLILHQAAHSVGSPQIRNRGTIGGNIVTSAQCADTIPALLSLDAVVSLLNHEGKTRTLGIAQFLTGPKKTDIRRDELLVSIRYPSLSGKGYRGGFYKLIRRAAVAKSRLNFAVIAQQDHQGLVTDIRISIGSALSVHARFSDAEKMLTGRVPTIEGIRKAAQCCVDQVVEQTGRRWSSAYKLPVIEDVLCRELEQVLECEE